MLLNNAIACIQWGGKEGTYGIDERLQESEARACKYKSRINEKAGAQFAFIFKLLYRGYSCTFIFHHTVSDVRFSNTKKEF